MTFSVKDLTATKTLWAWSVFVAVKSFTEKGIFFTTVIIKVQLWAWSVFVAVKSFTEKVIFFTTMIIKVQLWAWGVFVAVKSFTEGHFLYYNDHEKSNSGPG